MTLPSMPVVDVVGSDQRAVQSRTETKVVLQAIDLAYLAIDLESLQVFCMVKSGPPPRRVALMYLIFP